ncbi:MAG TPA: tyrosine-type recombinase/integrase, partial [Steroidobacteraceae bacterium]
QQLDVEGYRAIYAHAEGWLQLAMDLSLVTLQSRKEVCGMRHGDFRGGFLFVIRDKVAAKTQMAFIRISLTPELEALRERARKLDAVVSPYLVHRRPDRMQRRWIQGKDHWTYVNERYLTQSFAAARDAIPRYAALPERERPTFHEIRGLGSRLHLGHGVPKGDIQELMTHSNPRTTEIYLEKGAAALTDDDYRPVSAPFSLRELLGT